MGVVFFVFIFKPAQGAFTGCNEVLSEYYEQMQKGSHGT